MPIKIITGDITQQDADVIVNSANPTMLAGSGVSGAIHRAAGSALEKECRIIGHVDAGNAVLTAGYNLKAPFVIHAVAPQWFGGHNREEDFMWKCYQSIFEIVEIESFKRICIPAMGIGTYRWPIEKAAPIAIQSAQDFLAQHPKVTIVTVCFTEEIARFYEQIYLQHT